MKPMRHVFTLVLGLVAAAHGTAFAADIDAEALVKGQCTSCHGTEVYTRDDRRVQSLKMLEAQINRCTMATRAGWNDEQKAAVVKYLNDHYYHFSK